MHGTLLLIAMPATARFCRAGLAPAAALGQQGANRVAKCSAMADARSAFQRVCGGTGSRPAPALCDA